MLDELRTDLQQEGDTGNKPNSDMSKSKRKRRSKHEKEGRNYICEQCEKSYLSLPALNNHKNTKHNISGGTHEKRTRGRPRKYAPVEQKNDEDDILRFNNFFSKQERKKSEEEDIESHNISNIIKLVFDDILVKFGGKCYNQYKNYMDHPVLQKLFSEVPLDSKPKNEKVCDDVFYEYLNYCRNNTNKSYFILILKFAILFREFLDISRQKEINAEQPNGGAPFFKTEYSSVSNAETVPELCNEFVTEFLENNHYFGIELESDRNEIIELIQHFSTWLYVNGYTQSRLSRIS